MIDKTLLKTLRFEIDNAIKGIANKHNISLKVGNAKFTSTNATFKLEVATITSSGEVQTREAADFATMCTWYGMLPEHFGKTFEAQHKLFKIVGLKSRAGKYPIQVEDICTGRRYKMTEEMVKRGLKIV